MDNSFGIGDLATLISVVGLSIYVLGLVGLVIPIRRVFADDVSSAWYAVSLVSRIVVAGQGVRIWLAWTTVNIMLLLLCTVALRALPVSSAAQLLIFSLAFAQVQVVIIVLTQVVRKRREIDESRVESFFYVVVRSIGLLLAFCAFFIINPEVLKVEWLDQFWRDLVFALAPAAEGGDSDFLRGILLVSLAGFFSGLPTAMTSQPSLPKVEIAKQPQSGTEGVSEPLDGWLLAHSDGFWHLFDENSDLLAIPDDLVASVRIVMKPDKTHPEEDTKPDEQRAK